jgi:hypothetical protein
MQRHTTSHLEKKKKRGFLVRILGGRSLHTTKSIAAQIFVGVVINVSSHLYDFGCGPDCM